MQFHRKYWDFIDHKAPVEFMEGTTASGKTVAAVCKFLFEVAESPKKLHVIASSTTGTAEKNLIDSDAGIKHQFGALVDYRGNGNADHKLPHLVYHAPGGDKVAYILGYNDRDKWKNALGSQFGCVLIDEINTANIEFIGEIFMRCDYLLATLNPDDPGLPVYDEYINHSRPLPQYADDAPAELNVMLNAEPKPGWVHWFFTFDHNVWLTPEKRQQIIDAVPPGTKRYKNKISGLRGKSTGLIFDVKAEHIKPPAWVRKALEDKLFTFTRFTCGVDTAYSRRSDDSIAIVFAGITSTRKHIQLDELVLNNKGRTVPITPGDIPEVLIAFLEQQRQAWGFCRDVYIDSEDAGTILECQKYKRQNGSLYNFVGAFKKTKVLDRLMLESGWMARGDWIILDTCRESLRELDVYSWKEDKADPEDGNDHTVNARQYGWLPYKSEIGRQ
jgi:hypothetical protein